MWKHKPVTMLKKVAICQGFRLCFPELAGMPYGEEELGITMHEQYDEIPADGSHEPIPATGADGKPVPALPTQTAPVKKGPYEFEIGDDLICPLPAMKGLTFKALGNPDLEWLLLKVPNQDQKDALTAMLNRRLDDDLLPIEARMAERGIDFNKTCQDVIGADWKSATYKQRKTALNVFRKRYGA